MKMAPARHRRRQSGTVFGLGLHAAGLAGSHNLAMNIFEASRVSHAAQRQLADQLIQTQGDSPERALHDKAQHHLRDEEQGIFQFAGKVLSEAEKLSLAIDYEGEFVSQRLKA